LVQVIAATLGVQPRGGASLEASVVEFLRTRATLVVLDNCEHLLDAAAEFAEAVLAQCPDTLLVATSREALAVAGEQVWPLRSLRMPKESSVDVALASAAVQLFAERARAVAPDFTLDARNATAVLEVCRRLDGIPLAIELAASRVGAMSPAEIAGLLDERFRLLTGGRRNAVERHQTLRATVDWSYSLLRDSDRLVFDRLGVFLGTFDAAAAAAVVGGDGVEAWDVRDALAGLVGRSMLVAEPGDGGITRYGMLETLRHYARERIDETDEADRWRRNHARYYEQLAEQLGAALIGPDELAAHAHIRAELDNLRAAFTWALERPEPADVELGIGIIAALSAQAAIDMASGVGMWAEQALPHLDSTTPALRVSVLGAAAWTRLTCHADPEGATTLALDAITGPIPVGTWCPNLPYTALTSVYMFAGEYDAMFDTYVVWQQALDAIGGHPWDRTCLLSSWSNHLYLAGDHDAARAKADEALAVARSLQNPSALTLALFAEAYATWEHSPDTALVAIEESIALTRSGALDGAYGSALVISARLRANAGDLAGSIERSRDAVEYGRRVGDLTNSTWALTEAVATLAGQHESVLAAEIIGALEGGAELREIAYRLVTSEDDRRDMARQSVRDALGEVEFNAAWSRGAAMTVDEIALAAIAKLDELLASEADPRA
jgi:predicted ATPase